MLWRKLLATGLFAALISTGAANAQGTPVPPNVIQIGSTVSDTLAPDMPFRWWEFYAFSGRCFARKC